MKRNHNVNPHTLVIYYKKTKHRLQPETFHNIIEPDKIIERRNAPYVKKILYGGKKYDFKSHLNKYSESAIKQADLNTI